MTNTNDAVKSLSAIIEGELSKLIVFNPIVRAAIIEASAGIASDMGYSSDDLDFFAGASNEHYDDMMTEIEDDAVDRALREIDMLKRVFG